jgi:murein DD-endopeptidase MepM/ murein hydrolase activator NlpD
MRPGCSRWASCRRGPVRAGITLLALILLAACGGARPPPALGPSSAEPVTVTVQRGDTLLGIARRHDVGLQPLAAANGLRPPYRIRPGQVLHVPGSGPIMPAPVAVAGASSLGTPGRVQAPQAVASTTPPAAAEAQAAPMAPSAPAARAVTAEALPPAPSAPPSAASPSALPSAAGPSAATTARAAEPQRTAEATPRDQPPSRPVAEPATRRLPPGRFAWPVRGEVVSAFGSKGGGMVNDGLNIAAPRGTPVRAAADGVVLYAGNEVRGFGNLVLVRHENGWVTAYGHTDRVLVRQGQRVRLGEEIARVGSTGAVGSPQLHFQVRRDGRPVDPASHLERAVAGR